MTREELTKYAESIYPSQKGKHWIRTLRNARVEAFVNGALFMKETLQPPPIEKAKESYPCRFCDGVFTDEYDLDAHVNRNHNQFNN